jgi:hypothetical protein
MNPFKLKTLQKELRDNMVPQWKYILSIFPAMLFILKFPLSLYIPEGMRTDFFADYFYVGMPILGVVITIIGCILCYQTNRSGDNQDFFKRFFCLLCTIFFQVFFYFMVVFLVVNVAIMFSIPRTGLNETEVFDLNISVNIILSLFFQVIVYQQLQSRIQEVSHSPSFLDELGSTDDEKINFNYKYLVGYAVVFGIAIFGFRVFGFHSNIVSEEIGFLITVILFCLVFAMFAFICYRTFYHYPKHKKLSFFFKAFRAWMMLIVLGFAGMLIYFLYKFAIPLIIQDFST